MGTAVCSRTKKSHVVLSGIDPNGNPAIFLTRKVPIFDEKNNVLGLVGISIDITSQKKLEADLIKAKKETEMQRQSTKKTWVKAKVGLKKLYRKKSESK